MSGMDVLRERIAQALWDREAERQMRFQRRPWDEAEEWCRDAMRGYADAVIAELGLIPDVTTLLPGADFRRYITPWERIEEDG